MKSYSVETQLKLFRVQLLALIKELNGTKELDPETVQELIYTARQYINRRNKVRKK